MKKAVLLQTALFALPPLLLAVAGCKKQDPPPLLHPNVESAHSQPQQVKKEATVVVPPEVAGKWKAVRIAVINKNSVSQKIYTIPIGGAMKIPSTDMTVEVEAFLPAFIMEGSKLTSSSNELKNPGAKIKISEQGTVIFKGWLFSKFPSTHAFMHPTYGFTLVDVVPAGH